MAQAFLVQKSGGGINQTLPSQITAFTATADTTPSITLSWTNPTDYFEGVLIVKKIGSAPTGVSDGEKIYSGADTSFVDTAVEYGSEYFYRAFAYNAKKQYQTLYAVASATPVEGIPLSEFPVETLIRMVEGGEGVNFYLAKHDYESGLNGVGRQLMARKDCYDERQWHSSNVNAYATSDIDAWQNGDYKSLFSEAVQSMMGTTKFYYTVGNGNKTVTILERAIFLLSATEMGGKSSNDYYKMNSEGTTLSIAATLRNSLTNVMWTRTPSTGDYGSAFHIGASTTAAGNGVTAIAYSRPCFTLPADALVDPTPNADGSYNLLEVA